jgi:hypothetical protein
MFTTRESAAFFLGGFAIGLAGGLLFAPNEAIRTRSGLAYRLSNWNKKDVNFDDRDTFPLSEVSADTDALEKLRNELRS